MESSIHLWIKTTKLFIEQAIVGARGEKLEINSAKLVSYEAEGLPSQVEGI